MEEEEEKLNQSIGLKETENENLLGVTNKNMNRLGLNSYACFILYFYFTIKIIVF
ncbi:hypothetical protein LguiA_026097 [Lonicera macranthoides]